MEPRLLKTQHAEYVVGKWSGENKSGVDPVGDRVLILPDKTAEQSSGGIYLAADTLEKMSMAAETGILVAKGGGAFVWNGDRTRPFDGRQPEVGDHVFFEKYAGQLVLGNDGEFYRLADDKVIGGVEIVA